jgi:Uma2 family endonuclease
MSSFNASHAGPDQPFVDERLVAPGTRYEIYDGALAYVAPADEPHSTRHSKIAALVEAHVGREFDVAIDMLTRTSETSDIAPDVSVFPRARDPRTGGRQLEQIAFEVVSTETLGHAGRKAAKLVSRGVRRVFAIDVERSRGLEWSDALASWQMLDPGAALEDAVFAAPLPIDALVRAVEADDAVARALLIKQNPVIEQVRASDRAAGKQEGLAAGKQLGLSEGLARGRAEAVVALLDARGVVLRASDRAQILGERDPEIIARWLLRAATAVRAAELFDDGAR